MDNTSQYMHVKECKNITAASADMHISTHMKRMKRDRTDTNTPETSRSIAKTYVLMLLQGAMRSACITTYVCLGYHALVAQLCFRSDIQS